MAQHQLTEPERPPGGAAYMRPFAQTSDFVAEVASRLGRPPTDHLEPQVLEVLALLGARVPDDDARAVAARLPRRLSEALASAEHHIPAQDVSAFLKAAKERSVDERTCRATCRVLAEAVGEQGRAQLRVQPLSALFGARGPSIEAAEPKERHPAELSRPAS